MESDKVSLHKLNQMEHVCHIHHHLQWKSTNSISSARSVRGTESMGAAISVFGSDAMRVRERPVPRPVKGAEECFPPYWGEGSAARGG
jgi:hypothetical protein